MDLNNYPDISLMPMDCLANLSNSCFLLSDSSSSELMSSGQRPRNQLSDRARTSDFTAPSSFVPNVNTQSGDIISKIEDILQHMVDCIIDEKKELVLNFKPRIKPGNKVFDATNGAIKCSTTMEARTIRFPGKTAQEAWKFSMLKCESAQVLAESYSCNTSRTRAVPRGPCHRRCDNQKVFGISQSHMFIVLSNNLNVHHSLK